MFWQNRRTLLIVAGVGALLIISMIGGYLLLRPKQLLISGVVLDLDSLEGLDRAEVSVEGLYTASVLTTESGNYVIEAPAGLQVIIFEKQGYSPVSVEIEVNTDVDNLDIGMSRMSFSVVSVTTLAEEEFRGTFVSNEEASEVLVFVESEGFERFAEASKVILESGQVATIGAFLTSDEENFAFVVEISGPIPPFLVKIVENDLVAFDQTGAPIELPATLNGIEGQISIKPTRLDGTGKSRGLSKLLLPSQKKKPKLPNLLNLPNLPKWVLDLIKQGASVTEEQISLHESCDDKGNWVVQYTYRYRIKLAGSEWTVGPYTKITSTPSPLCPTPTPEPPTPTPEPTATPSTQGGGALLPPPVLEGSTLVSVSPDGSILSTDDALTTVIFPAGAVSDPATVIYMPQPRIPVDSFDLVRLFSLEAYSGYCEWQKFTDFNKPVTIQVSYSPEEVSGIDEEQLGLYYFDSALNEWVALDAVADPAGDSVTVNELNYFTLHFTLYALMSPVEAVAD
jgi:hypothetical protein